MVALNTPERLRAKMAAHTEVSPEGCILWTGPLQSDGYASVAVAMKTTRWHRVAYELANGPIPPGLTIDHLCHTYSNCRLGNACPHRRCLNPDHMELVTHVENTRRAGWRTTTCRHGHEFTPENTRRDKRGHRKCRRCVSDNDRRRRAMKREAAA